MWGNLRKDEYGIDSYKVPVQPTFERARSNAIPKTKY